MNYRLVFTTTQSALVFKFTLTQQTQDISPLEIGSHYRYDHNLMLMKITHICLFQETKILFNNNESIR